MQQIGALSGIRDRFLPGQLVIRKTRLLGERKDGPAGIQQESWHTGSWHSTLAPAVMEKMAWCCTFGEDAHGEDDPARCS